MLPILGGGMRYDYRNDVLGRTVGIGIQDFDKIMEGNSEIKIQFEELLQGKHLRVPVDEQIVYNQLDENENAIWSLLLASGYLKVLSYDDLGILDYDVEACYELTLTKQEVRKMFKDMVKSWFRKSNADYNAFLQAMLTGNRKAMNVYMNRVALTIFSYFDTGKRPTGQEPERFYHGFAFEGKNVLIEQG